MLAPLEGWACIFYILDVCVGSMVCVCETLERGPFLLLCPPLVPESSCRLSLHDNSVRPLGSIILQPAHDTWLAASSLGPVVFPNRNNSS